MEFMFFLIGCNLDSLFGYTKFQQRYAIKRGVQINVLLFAPDFTNGILTKFHLVKEFNKPLPDVGNIACYCGHCHNQSVYAIRTINCVTLFFIPVLPFYFSKRLKCTICNTSGDINADIINRLKQGQPVALG